MKKESIVVLVLSFGKGKGEQTNTANYMLAEVATSLEYFTVADASVPLTDSGCKNYRIIGSGSKEKHESTVTILESALSLYENFGNENVKKILIVAATPHMPRVMRDAKKIFKDTDVLLEEVKLFGRWFYGDSTQLWTTSFWFWWPREFLFRVLPWKTYYWLSKKFG